MTVLSEKIRTTMQQAKLSQSELARRIDVTRGTVNDWYNGRVRNISGDNLMALASTLKVSPQWLSSEEDTILPTIFSSDENFISIPMMSATAAMGAGISANLNHDEQIGAVLVTRKWLDSNLRAFGGIKHLHLITGRGDSMEGSFSDGDVLFVDTSILKIETDGIYVFDFDGELFIKRLLRNPNGSLDMISDNKQHYPSKTISRAERESLRIVGKIVGAWHTKQF